MSKLLKWLNWTLLLPLLLIVLLLMMLLYTAPGLKFSLWLGQKFVPQLTVAKHSGSLLGGMQVTDLRWHDGNNQLQLGQLHLNINNFCFFQLKICASELTVTDATVQLGQTTLRLGHFTTAVEAWGREVQFNDSQLHQLKIELAASTAESTEQFSYQPPALTNITLPLAVYINGFSLTDASLIQPEKLTPLPDIHFSLQARGQSIRLLDFQASHPLANVSATAELFTQGDYPLRAHSSATLKQAPWAGQQLNVSVSGSLADLAATARTQGSINATVSSKLALLSANLPLSVEVQYEPFSWPLEDSEAWQIKGGALTASGDLQQLQFTVHGGLAHSTVPQFELNAAGQYQLADAVIMVNRFSAATLDGNISGSARVELAPELNWQTDLSLSSIQPGGFWPEFNGELNGNLANRGALSADGSWQTELTQLAIDGSLRNELFNISGDLTAGFHQPTDRYRFSTEQLVLQHGDNRISVNGSLAEQWQVDAKVDIPDLASSLPVASGVIKADIAVRGNQRQPELSANIFANTLSYAEFRLAQLTLDVQLRQDELIQASIELNASDGRWQGYQLEQLAVTGAGNEGQHQLSVALQSSVSDININLSGQLTDRNRWQGQLTHANIGSPVGNWQLQHAIDLLYQHQKQQLDISRHCWQQNSGSLCLTDDASLSPASLAANIELRQFNLASLNEFTPLALALSGDLSASASANWQSGHSPQVELTVQSVAGALTERTEPPIALQWQQLNLTSQLKDDQLSATLQATLNEQAQLTSELAIADISSANRPLNARLQLTGFTLAFLQPLLDEYSELAGVFSADITAEGSVENPLLAGQLALQQLRVKGKLAPTDINDGNLQVDFKGEQADLRGDIATPEGKLTLSGEANWQQLDDWRAQLAIKGDPLSIQIEQGSLKLKPDLEITANPTLVKVSGKVDIPSAQFSIDELPQNAIGVSSDTIILNAERQPITEQQAMAIPLEADIGVQLGEKVALEAFGLETLLRGSLQVQQRQNRQTINGEIRLVDGTFRSYGQDLLIRQGKMNFTGPPDQPYLNVEAIRNPANMEDSVVAGIRVTGPADRPQITIFSEPAMPQANALSYLLVGRDLDSESGSAANAVTTSLIGMSIASSGNLVGEIGEAFGVSDLTLDTAGSGDSSQVTVSGYLNRDLQIKYGIGIFEPIGIFTLRYRLMQSLYLEAVSGLDNAVDLLYHFEFD